MPSYWQRMRAGFKVLRILEAHPSREAIYGFALGYREQMERLGHEYQVNAVSVEYGLRVVYDLLLTLAGVKPMPPRP